MWKFCFPLLLAASLTAAVPVHAEPNFGEIFPGIAQSLLNQELDRTGFAEVQRLNSASAYRSYLTKFPKGAYRLNAEQALAKLGVPVPPPPSGGGNISAASIEASIGLGRAQRTQIQKPLTVIGYPSGVADGL